MTEGDLLDRRRQDAAAVLASLRDPATLPDDAEPDDEVLMELVELRLRARRPAGVAALPGGDQARARHAAGHPQRGRPRRRRSSVRDLRLARLSARRAGAGGVGRRLIDPSRDREDVRRAARGFVARDVPLLLLGPPIPVRAEGVAVPLQRPALARRRRRLEPHPHVAEPRRRGSEQPRAFDDERQRRVDGVRLGGRADAPSPSAPRRR